MLRRLKTIRFWRNVLLMGAMAGFAFGALQLAVPFHEAACAKDASVTHCPCPDSSDAPEHDADQCAICHHIFGLTGKTLPPSVTTEPAAVEKGLESFTRIKNHPVIICNPHIIPRAPPVA